MQAMILQSPRPAEDNPLTVVEISDPSPGPGEIRVRVHSCGVCHTDLHTVEGEMDLPTRPVIPGHQIAGEIDRVGAGVTRFSPGDRVGVAWLHSACGQRDYCRRGLENLCNQAQFTGFHTNGGYAQYTIAPAASAYPLPPTFSDLQVAPLLCAGVIGYRSLRLSEIHPGERLGLFGFGASAHVTIQVACHWGCEVFVFTRSEGHKQHARELGAARVGDAGDNPPHPVDSAITFAPPGWIVVRHCGLCEKAVRWPSTPST